MVCTYVQENFSEEEWAQLEGAASCAKVLKVEVDVLLSIGDHARGFTTLAAGLVRNKALRDVELKNVPEEVKLSLRETLHSNTQLITVNVQ